MESQSIGIIGVGKMGGGIARTLARETNCEVLVYDKNSAAVAACTAVGARAAESIAEVASAGVVISSLPLPEHVLAVWQELAPQLRPGTIAMDVSTIDPHTAVELESLLVGEGCSFVVCLLGKGPQQAETGELPLFVGGNEETLAALDPIFSAIGGSLHHLGDVAAATTFKLVSNLVGMANLAVLCEGYELCRQAGVHTEAFTSALADTGNVLPV